jgi:site-specific recombinase XerD
MSNSLQHIHFYTGNHRDKPVIWCKFPKDNQLLLHLKKEFPSAKWSNTQKCWYIFDAIEIRKKLGINLKEPHHKIIHTIHPINQNALIHLSNHLKIKAYSPNTRKVYISEFAQLLQILEQNPVDLLNSDKLKSYFLYCLEKLKISENQLHSRINAIKFYFEQVLGREKFMFTIPRPKSPSKLPKVIDTKDIQKLFKVIQNPKHKLMLQLCYGMGLRVSEIVNLKIHHIDSKRMQVLVQNAKGKSDRYVNLPSTILEDLRNYYKQYKPKEYLFEGQYGGQYTIRSTQAVFKQAMKKANIKKPIGIHSLRHSFATHLLEQGTDLALIQNLLGHKHIKTTLLYAKVGRKDILKIKSPLDSLNL